MNAVVSTFPDLSSSATGALTAAGTRPLSMRLTLAVWTAASIGGWAVVLLVLLPLL